MTACGLSSAPAAHHCNQQLPVPFLQRLLKVRAWRTGLSPLKAAQWKGTRLLGADLRKLTPAHLSCQLEQELAETMAGGEQGELAGPACTHQAALTCWVRGAHRRPGCAPQRAGVDAGRPGSHGLCHGACCAGYDHSGRQTARAHCACGGHARGKGRRGALQVGSIGLRSVPSSTCFDGRGRKAPCCPRCSLAGRIFTAQATIHDGGDEDTARSLGIPRAAIQDLLDEGVRVLPN